MSLLVNTPEPAIVRGIKTVGIGKKGRKPLSVALAQEILADLKGRKVSAAAEGAFYAGLMAKGITAEEASLGEALQLESITKGAPEFARAMCLRLMNGQTLDTATAHRLGKFLLSDGPGDGARGFIASYLRVRYETEDEYAGIWQAMQETIAPAFRGPTPPGEPIVQIAEPFDGNDHSYLVTPVVADFVQRLGFRAIHMVGRNSGPKLVYNLLDVAAHLPGTFAARNLDLNYAKPRHGWFLRQAEVSPALDRWVSLRHQTIKRPFLATLEKFIKPVDADIIVTSAFHPPYGEKMLAISERAGFAGAMVIRNGMEGSTAFPLKRPAKILLSARQNGGRYLRHEITFEAERFLGTIVPVEEQRKPLTAQNNAYLIKEYTAQGHSGDQWFDLRVKATCEGFRQGLGWLTSAMERG